MVSVWYCQFFFCELEESLQMWGPQVTEEVLRETFGTLGCNGDVQQETRDVVGWCRLRAIFIFFFLVNWVKRCFPHVPGLFHVVPSISSFSNCWCTSQCRRYLHSQKSLGTAPTQVECFLCCLPFLCVWKMANRPSKSRSFGPQMATATWPRSCDAIERAWGLGDPRGPCQSCQCRGLTREDARVVSPMKRTWTWTRSEP